MLFSTALISWAPKPVEVRLCFGRLKPGPTGPCKVLMGAPTEGLRSLVEVVVAISTIGVELSGDGVICERRQDD